MSLYSGAEVFEMAMEMEEARREFYETLAELSRNPALRELLLDLAAQEASHFAKFRQMGKELVERPASRPLTWDELSFAQLLVEERVELDPDTVHDIAEKGGVEAILDVAISLEKDSVLFYQELLAEVDEQDTEAIGRIVAEEKSHVRALIEAKKKLILETKDAGEQ